MRNKILKYVWLILAILSLGIAIHAFFNSGINEAIQYLLVAIIAFLIYILRK